MLPGFFRLSRTAGWKLDRINKFITLPAFSFRASEDNKSLLIQKGASANTNTEEVNLTGMSFSFEFWLNLSTFPTTVTMPAGYNIILSIGKLDFRLYKNNLLRVALFRNAFTGNTIVESNITNSNWIHIAVTFDFTVGTLKLYINGVLADSETLLTDGYENGSRFSITNKFVGYISDIRLWNTVRTAEQILASYQSPRSIYYDVEPGLICYWKCNTLTDAGEVEDSVGAEHLVLSDSDLALLVDEAPPRLYGASWPVARALVNLGQVCSLKYPIKNDNPTCALVVYWVDSSGNSQRRYLWTTDKVNFGSLDITEYNGEALPSTGFYLEVWNEDGIPLAESYNTVTLKLSITTMPTTSVDKTAVSAGSATMTNSIYSTIFPLVFPITLNNAPESGVTLLNLVVEGGDLTV